METETSRVQKLLNFQEHEIVYLKGRVAELEAALRKIAQHDMQAIALDALRPGERAALAGEKKDE